jgi:hypothetical protein
VNVSISADPTSLVCQCAAGFEPSPGNNSCLACGVGRAKNGVGNHGCDCDAGYKSSIYSSCTAAFMQASVLLESS